MYPARSLQYASRVGVVDPERSLRRGRVLRLTGIVLTVVGALLLILGVAGILTSALGSDPFGAFDFFWMPFVGGFALVAGVWMWVGGNLMLRSAEFARGGSSMLFTPVSSPAPTGVWTCPRCGNGNQVGAVTCSVCGASKP